ncbi:MAG: amino acid permease [Bacteroidota bacterium]
MELFRRKSIGSILEDAKRNSGQEHTLKQNLNVRDLTSLGIAAIIGAGIFSTIGNAAAYGGPAVSLLFVFTAIACGFSAMCYAHFASAIPISGSAYTYAYATFGELVAWIIGWDLIMEYAVGNIAVAISWSDYFTSLMNGMGVHVPAFLCTDYLSAYRGFTEVTAKLAQGIDITTLSTNLQEAYSAWQTAPQLFGLKIIADIPAFSIVVFITALVYRGIYESKVAGNLMVLLKLVILMLIIGVGAFYVNPDNWSPFAPNGIAGVMKGVSGVFFAYIGFDAISTTAEECKNPKRDLPRAMILSLIITTVLYVIISLVLTGLVNYSELAVGDPLAYAFEKLHLTKFSGIIALSAVIAMASVLLVFQVGQPRIWMSMSRDGLLPRIFSKLHPKYKTPAFSTIITGVLVAVPTLFLNLTEVTDLTSIGTLFAFVLVSGGLLFWEKRLEAVTADGVREKRFRVPYINCRIYLPIVWIVLIGVLFIFDTHWISNWFNAIDFSSWDVFKHQIFYVIYFVAAVVLTVVGIVHRLSLIPMMGLLTNLYLMTELGITNWMRFIIWLIIGLALYFMYGKRFSRLKSKQ